jgi:hypothetical protein
MAKFSRANTASDVALDHPVKNKRQSRGRYRYRLCWIKCSCVLFCFGFWALVAFSIARLLG